MATSNSTNFTMTTSEIVSDSLRLLDVLGIGETLSGEDYSLGVRQLNLMIKSWQAQGIHLWTETEGIVFTDADQASYELGGSSPDKASEEDIKTELSADADSGATSLTVDSTTGMAASDNIGIELDSGAIQWTTISSVDSSTTLTLAAALTGDAATDNNVYAYTTDLTRPLEISSVRFRNDDGTDTTLRRLSRDDYFKLSNKASEGRPNSFYFDRQRDKGILYVYPVPTDCSGRLMITFSRQIHDFDASTDNPDLPTEWLEAIIWNLAIRLSPFFGREDKAAKVSPVAAELLQAVKGWDKEHASYYIR